MKQNMLIKGQNAGRGFGLKTALMGLAAMVVLPACSTPQVNRVASAAPISYKTGMNTSYSAPSSVIAPQSYSNSAPLALPSIKTPSPRPVVLEPMLPMAEFDSKAVDRDLYAHQRVGKPYKINGKRYTPKHEPKYNEKGQASWYGPNFHGKPTATGEIFDMHAMTAAHKTLPLNSMAHVENLETGASIMVRINDRGPFVDGRIIDLSKAAAEKLGVIEHGTAKVRVRYAGPADPNAAGDVVDAPQPQYAMTPTPEPKLNTAPSTAPQLKPVDLSDLTEQATLEVPQSAPVQAPVPEGYQPLRRGAPIGLEALTAKPAPSSKPSAVIPYVAPTPAPTPLADSQADAGPVPRLPVAPVRPAQPYATPSAPMSRPAFPKRLPEDTQPGADDVITLTIEGPIHMATDRKVIIIEDKGDFVPATYRKVIQ